MKGKIKVDYEILQQLIGHIDHAVVPQIGGETSTLEKIIENEIRPTWKGLAATQFFTDWEHIRENLHKLQKALEIVGPNLDHIAQIFHAAEEKAKGHMRKESTDIFSTRH